MASNANTKYSNRPVLYSGRLLVAPLPSVGDYVSMTCGSSQDEGWVRIKVNNSLGTNIDYYLHLELTTSSGSTTIDSEDGTMGGAAGQSHTFYLQTSSGDAVSSLYASATLSANGYQTYTWSW